jgi:hypothetical protein
VKQLLALLVVPVALLAGCSGGDHKTASPTFVNGASAGAGTGTGTGTGTGPGGNNAGGTPRCHTADLSLKLGPKGKAAGTFHNNLIFIAKSSHPCTLSGFPTVSWVTSENGTRVNEPFKHSKLTQGTDKTITLAPGQQARAVLVTKDTGKTSKSRCDPVSVRGYRITPPGETKAIFVSASGKQCSAKGVNLGQVLPIEGVPGTGRE